MSDRELLELAAKAVGIEIYESDVSGSFFDVDGEEWNPLADDGEALRLAVKLDINIYPKYQPKEEAYVSASCTHSAGAMCSYFNEPYGNDKQAAARRVIVKAAALIGKHS